jgi:hypothetical protein
MASQYFCISASLLYSEWTLSRPCFTNHFQITKNLINIAVYKVCGVVELKRIELSTS